VKPDDLDGEASVFWDSHVGMLHDAGLMDPLFASRFQILCELWGEVRELTRTVSEEGLTYSTPTGFVRERPEVKILAETRKAFLSSAADFGMDPTSILRLHSGAGPVRDDETVEFLFGGRGSGLERSKD
jgi:P27 family predicted phage terminase small subunit